VSNCSEKNCVFLYQREEEERKNGRGQSGEQRRRSNQAVNEDPVANFNLAIYLVTG